MALLLDPDDEAATNGATHGANFSRPADAVAQPSQGECDRSFWTKKAPGVLRREGLDPEAAWNAFWSKRKAPATVARLVHAAGAPVIWGWNIEAVTEECRGLVDIADQLARGAAPDKFAKGKRRASLEAAVGAWLETARDGDTDVSFALGTLAAAHLLHQLGKQLGPEQGWPLVDLLLATARDAGSWQVDVDAPGASALAQQLAAGELPLTLAYLFPEMAPLAALRRGARDQLATGLAELADERGFVRAAHLDVWRPLLACWIRTRAIAEQNAKFAWDEAAEGKLGRVLRQALRWTEAGTGRPLLTNAQVPAWSADFLAAAVRVCVAKSEASAARALLCETNLADEVPSSKRPAPKPAAWSEPAQLAVMRSQWSPRASTVAIDYSSLGMRVAVHAAGTPLFAGVWGASSRLNGRVLKPTGPWEEVCWFTDQDVDFMELVLPLEGEARLERQILLARSDEFLLLADHLQTAESEQLEHAWTLPLAGGVSWTGEVETREARIARVDGEPLARALPLALPEWRIDPRVGELTYADGLMRLEERTVGRALACPLFFDLKPKRIGRPCTWRQLTVAELLKIQPPDVAVAYRAQCGKNQWVIYRSQAPRGNRTFLGQNTSSEFYVARFLARDGSVEELVQVEG